MGLYTVEKASAGRKSEPAEHLSSAPLQDRGSPQASETSLPTKGPGAALADCQLACQTLLSVATRRNTVAQTAKACFCNRPIAYHAWYTFYRQKLALPAVCATRALCRGICQDIHCRACSRALCGVKEGVARKREKALRAGAELTARTGSRETIAPLGLLFAQHMT